MSLKPGERLRCLYRGGNVAGGPKIDGWVAARGHSTVGEVARLRGAFKTWEEDLRVRCEGDARENRVI